MDELLSFISNNPSIQSVLLQDSPETVLDLYHLFMTSGYHVGNILKISLSRDVSIVSKPDTILRDDSIGIKMFRHFSSEVGRPLIDVIRRPLLSICDEEISRELDPNRLDYDTKKSKKRKDREIKTNREWFITAMTTILKSITDTVITMPDDICDICNHIYWLAESTSEGCGNRTVASVLFLRFFCPLLSQPDKLNLRAGSVARRNLVLLSKAIQHLANDAGEMTKQKFMTFYNPHVDGSQKRIRNFVRLLLARKRYPSYKYKISISLDQYQSHATSVVQAFTGSVPAIRKFSGSPIPSPQSSPALTRRTLRSRNTSIHSRKGSLTSDGSPPHFSRSSSYSPTWIQGVRRTPSPLSLNSGKHLDLPLPSTLVSSARRKSFTDDNFSIPKTNGMRKSRSHHSGLTSILRHSRDHSMEEFKSPVTFSRSVITIDESNPENSTAEQSPPTTPQEYPRTIYNSSPINASPVILARGRKLSSSPLVTRKNDLVKQMSPIPDDRNVDPQLVSRTKSLDDSNSPLSLYHLGSLSQLEELSTDTFSSTETTPRNTKDSDMEIRQISGISNIGIYRELQTFSSISPRNPPPSPISPRFHVIKAISPRNKNPSLQAGSAQMLEVKKSPRLSPPSPKSSPRRNLGYTFELLLTAASLELPNLNSISVDSSLLDLKNAILWTYNHVAKWISSQPDVSTVADLFREWRISGKDLLFITREQLEEIGVEPLGLRLRVMIYVKKLKEKAICTLEEFFSRKSNISTWSRKDVSMWLALSDMEEFIGTYYQKKITGKQLLQMSREDLRKTGLIKLSQILKVWKLRSCETSKTVSPCISPVLSSPELSSRLNRSFRSNDSSDIPETELIARLEQIVG